MDSDHVFSSTDSLYPEKKGVDISPVERWMGGVLLATGLLMFFFPVLTVTLPIVGERSYTGYDVVVSSRGVDDVKGQLPPEDDPSSDSQIGEDIEWSFAMQFGFLIPIAVACAFLASIAGLFAILFSRTLLSISGFLGAIAGVVAIIHIRVFNSDMHGLLERQITKMGDELQDNPFRGLAEGMSQLMVGGVNILPGIGLYVLTACLALCLILVRTRILTRVSIAPLPESD